MFFCGLFYHVSLRFHGNRYYTQRNSMNRWMLCIRCELETIRSIYFSYWPKYQMIQQMDRSSMSVLFDVYRRLQLINNFQKSDGWGVPLVLFVLADGERGGLPFSGHWMFCTGSCQYLLYMKCPMYGLLFLQLSTSLRCFRPRTFYFKNGLD